MKSRLVAQLRLIFDLDSGSHSGSHSGPTPGPSSGPSREPSSGLHPEPSSGLVADIATPRLVRHPRARRYVLRLQPDGTPRVTIPRWGSQREALAFVAAQHDWVVRERARQIERARQRPSRAWVDGAVVLLAGQSLTLRRGEAPAPGVDAEHPGELRVTPRAADGANLHPVAATWMLRRARRLLPPRLLELAAGFALDVTHVSIRNQRARWGSCATGGRISLNWRLVQTPDAVRDYVLIHELMHLRQPNQTRSATTC
jgi:predicted metal-dependent hydrolase